MKNLPFISQYFDAEITPTKDMIDFYIVPDIGTLWEMSCIDHLYTKIWPKLNAHRIRAIASNRDYYNLVEHTIKLYEENMSGKEFNPENFNTCDGLMILAYDPENIKSSTYIETNIMWFIHVLNRENKIFIGRFYSFRISDVEIDFDKYIQEYYEGLNKTSVLIYPSFEFAK